MQYRSFGKLNWKASALGFGCMRLPVISDDHSKINEPEATKMVRHAIDQGVNYLDTAYPYHGGNSELFVGRVLQDGYREKVRLATKMPAWLVNTRDDFDRFLNEQLVKLQTSNIDFYLLHGLGSERWKKLKAMGVLKWGEKAITSGLIGHLGFSFHDSYEVFKEIVDASDLWTFCQIQYNYMDIENQAGTAGLKYAAEKGLAVVVMEPLLGGRLANPPQPIQDLWASAEKKRSPVEWALGWLWNQPEVSVVLSGMSTLQHVEDNLIYASRSRIGSLSSSDLNLVEQVRRAYRGISPIPCTKCEYCLPCPNGLNIPGLLDLFNSSLMYNYLTNGRRSYYRLPEPEKAHNCGQCFQCEDLCPQHIQISDWMTTIHQVLGEGKEYSLSV